MATLCRTCAGGFLIQDAYTLEKIEKMAENERISLLRPVEELFSYIPCVKLPAFYEKLSRNGCEIYQSKIKTSFPTSTRVRLCDANGNFYALGEVRDFENGSAIKAIKMFDI